MTNTIQKVDLNWATYSSNELKDIKKCYEKEIDIFYYFKNFKRKQFLIIFNALAGDENEDISLWAKKEYNGNQMYEIRAGLLAKLDVSWYADPKFNEAQMYEIRRGLISGVDVFWYADPKFHEDQMEQLRQCLESGLDVSGIADPDLDPTQMLTIALKNKCFEEKSKKDELIEEINCLIGDSETRMGIAG
jgi:hypothetical protein